MISVVIPTRNRSATLAATLDALTTQEDAEFEVIVVDNGSNDDTTAVAQAAAERFRAPLQVLSQPKPGPAAARNLGVAHSAGDFVLFLGDDMAPADAHLVAGHAARHAAHPEPDYGVLGRVTWKPSADVTRFMRWLEAGGPQFDFGSLEPGPVPAETHFYTSNVSVKRRLLHEVGDFDERFPYAAVEDVELGGRLAERGLRLEFVPSLLVHHDHPTTLDQSLARMVRVGQSAALYNRLHPDRPRPRELPTPQRSLYVRTLHPVARFAARGPLPSPLQERAWLILHTAAYERGYDLGPPDA